MDGLRISLLVIGVLVVAGIYFWDRFARRRRSEESRRSDDDAQFTARDPYHELDSLQDRRAARNVSAASGDYDIDDLDSDVPPEPSVDVGALEGLRAKRDESLSETPPKIERDPDDHGASVEELVVALTVMGKGGGLPGSAVRESLRAAGLTLGAMNIYHRLAAEPPRDALFSVANLVEPGTLDDASLEGISTPGLAVFMQLPGPGDPAATFDEMLDCAHRVASGLDAAVCDERRNPLTAQVANHLRERIAEYQRRSLVQR